LIAKLTWIAWHAAARSYCWRRYPRADCEGRAAEHSWPDAIASLGCCHIPISEWEWASERHYERHCIYLPSSHYDRLGRWSRSWAPCRQRARPWDRTTRRWHWYAVQARRCLVHHSVMRVRYEFEQAVTDGNETRARAGARERERERERDREEVHTTGSEYWLL